MEVNHFPSAFIDLGKKMCEKSNNSATPIKEAKPNQFLQSVSQV